MNAFAGRRGDRARRRPPLTPVLLWVTLAVLGAGLSGGCGGPPPPGCPARADLFSAFRVDSLGLTEFSALSPAEQDQRRAAAAGRMAEAHRSNRLDRRIGALVAATGLAPDDPEPWLELAEILRWVGDDLQTMAALEAAVQAVRHQGERGDPARLDQGEIRKLSLRTALLRAWLHFDRAEWREAMNWARAAMAADPGSAAGRKIMGLLAANLAQRTRARQAAGDIRRADPFATEPVWIQATIERAQGFDREAIAFLLDLRPRGEFSAECWRDMGLTAEQAGEWSFAGKWYRESAAALPFGDRTCLAEVTHARLAPGPESSRQPVWIGLERAYVTGSRSAYTALAFERFEQAQDPAEREYWAGAAVNSAGICLRLGIDRPWALRAKGLVFAATGMEDRALSDLRLASQDLVAAGTPDARVESELGRLLVLRDQDHLAKGHLNRAVELDDRNARAWSDLGLALIRTGDRVGAERALTAAIRLDPRLATAWYNRGLLHINAGDLDKAEADLQEAVSLAPGNQEIIHLLQRLNVVRQRGGQEP